MFQLVGGGGFQHLTHSEFVINDDDKLSIVAIVYGATPAEAKRRASLVTQVLNEDEGEAFCVKCSQPFHDDVECSPPYCARCAGAHYIEECTA